MSDSTYKKVKEYLVQKGYHAVPDETYDHIDEWLEWYQNDVEKFHHYKLYNGAVMTNQERYKLGMAKTVCEDWANLLLNEKVSIKAGSFIFLSMSALLSSMIESSKSTVASIAPPVSRNDTARTMLIITSSITMQCFCRF